MSVVDHDKPKPCMRTLYFDTNKAKQHMACVDFLRIVVPHHSLLGLFQPNPDAAPWHWRGSFPEPSGRGGVIAYNFWPHLGKWQREGEQARIGWQHWLTDFDRQL